LYIAPYAWVLSFLLAALPISVSLPSFIYPRGGLLVGYKVGVLVGLQGRVLIGLQRNPSRRPILFSLRIASLRVPGDLSLISS
jgi:hypothetical protein